MSGGHENFISKPPAPGLLPYSGENKSIASPNTVDCQWFSNLQPNTMFLFCFFFLQKCLDLPWYLCVGLEEIVIIFDPEYSIKPCHPRH